MADKRKFDSVKYCPADAEAVQIANDAIDRLVEKHMRVIASIQQLTATLRLATRKDDEHVPEVAG